MQLSEYHRELDTDTQTFLGVYSSSVSWKSPASGFIGIGPYSAKQEASSKNFMVELINKGKIFNNMVSFYVSDKVGNFSTVKFGDYDIECINGQSITAMTFF